MTHFIILLMHCLCYLFVYAKVFMPPVFPNLSWFLNEDKFIYFSHKPYCFLLHSLKIYNTQIHCVSSLYLKEHMLSFLHGFCNLCFLFQYSCSVPYVVHLFWHDLLILKFFGLSIQPVSYIIGFLLI